MVKRDSNQIALQIKYLKNKNNSKMARLKKLSNFPPSTIAFPWWKMGKKVNTAISFFKTNRVAGLNRTHSQCLYHIYQVSHVPLFGHMSNDVLCYECFHLKKRILILFIILLTDDTYGIYRPRKRLKIKRIVRFFKDYFRKKLWRRSLDSWSHGGQCLVTTQLEFTSY